MLNQNNRSCSKEELLKRINEISFAVVELTLFLDTHPENEEALSSLKEHSESRNRALMEYAAQYGPLTVDTALEDCSRRWDWIMQPWPWEGGC